MTQYPFRNRSWGRAFDEGTAEGAELDGLRVVFDQKVGLHPANLQKTAGPTGRKAVPRNGANMMAIGRRYGRR